jgi:flagellar basal-body rod protein FlgG
VIERPWIDYSPGVVHPTGNPLDLALSGNGFFAVDGPAGPLYTRNGNFRLSADGRLVTPDGYAVRSSSGTPVALDGSKVVEFAADGTIRQDGTLMGRLEIADFTSMASLRKQGSNYFRTDDGSLKPVAPSGTLVEQGKLEASNTGSAEAAVRLVSVMRQFEMLQKAVNLGTEMDRRAVEEVAKV